MLNLNLKSKANLINKKKFFSKASHITWKMIYCRLFNNDIKDITNDVDFFLVNFYLF